MKLKTVTIDGKVFAEIVDDKPVYVYDDGKEVPFDAPANVAKISSLNAEAKGHREAKEAAEETLKKFASIEDPAAAAAALETVANLKSGELTTAAKVQEIKDAAKKAADEQVAEVRKSLETQVTQLSTENSNLRNGWDSERIGTHFANSKYVADKLAVPGAVAQKIFGDSFKIEDGKMVGYGPDGKKIYSRESPGDAAPFEEALSQLVDNYAFRDSIVRGSGGGSGGGRGNGGGANGAKELSRSEFDQLAPSDRQARMNEGYTVVEG